MAQHLVNVSGGKDSTAVYLRALELGRPFRAVFADTGHEHEWTYEFVDRLAERTGGPKVEIVRADFARQMAGKREYIAKHWPQEGIAPEIVQAAIDALQPTGNPYLDLCIWKSRFPSRRAQFCTDELKTLPIITQVVLPMLKARPVLQWLGIRADESPKRAKQPRWNRHESGCYLWRPIFDWRVSDVWAIHARHGLEPNPLYLRGMGRVGCMPCINCTLGEFSAIARQFPEHMERIERWERIVGRASKHQRATFFHQPGAGSEDFWKQQPGGGCASDLALCEFSGKAA